MAIDTSIQVAEDTAKELWLKPLFVDPQAVGMTKPEYTKYSKLLEKQFNLINENALKAARQEAARRQTADWKEAEGPIRADVIREINLQRDFQALEFLTKGRFVGEDIPVPEGAKVKLDRKAVEAITEDPLPRGTTQKKGGILPDDAAELFGFGSGEELVRALVSLERDRAGRPMSQYKKALIDEEVTQRLEERFGILDENIEREAYESALTINQENLLATEMAVLGKGIGAPPFDVDGLRAWASDTFVRTPVGRARNLKEYGRLVGKAGRAAELALLAGDTMKAFEAKQIQFKAFLLNKEAARFARETARAEKRFARLGRKGVGRDKDKNINVDQGHMNQIHGLLARHGYTVKRDMLELDRTLTETPLSQFVNENIAATGGTVVVPRTLWGTSVVDLENTSVEYFRDLADAIKSIENSGKAAKKIEVQGIEIAREEAVRQLVEQVNTLPARKDHRGRVGKFVGYLNHAKYLGDGWLTHTKRLFDDLDDFAFGPFNRFAMTRLREAFGQKLDMEADVGQRAQNIRPPKGGERAVPNPLFRDSTFRDNPLMEINRAEMRVIALNMGNVENTERLIHGFFPETHDNISLYIDRRNQVMDWLTQHMKNEDWDHVQKVWGLFEGLWPTIRTKMIQRFGVERGKKTPQPLQRADGRTVAGGYYPMFRDPIRSPPQDHGTLFGNHYQGVETWHGFMEEMVPGTVKSVVHIKDAEGLFPHRIRQMIHDLTMHDAILDVQKLLSDEEVNAAITQTHGPEYNYRSQFFPFLRALANKHSDLDGALTSFSDMSRGMRGRLATSIFGLLHSVILTPSMGNIGRNLVRLSTHPAETFQLLYMDTGNGSWLGDFAEANSPTLRNWLLEGYNRHLDDMAARPSGVTRVDRVSQKLGFAAVAFMERRLGRLAWITEYLLAKQQGMNEADAIAYAEKKLNDDFPRTSTLDIAPIMRDGGEPLRWTTFAYSYFDFIYNRTRRIKGLTQSGIRDVRQRRTAQGTRKFVEAFSEFLTFYALNALIGAAVSGGSIFEEDDSVGEMVVKAGLGQFFASIYLVRDVYRAAQGHSTNIQHPVVKIMDGMVRGVGKEVESIYTEGELTDEWFKNLYTPTAMFLGVPALGPGRFVQFWIDYAAGREDPRGFIEWYRGLTTGKAEK